MGRPSTTACAASRWSLVGQAEYARLGKPRAWVLSATNVLLLFCGGVLLAALLNNFLLVPIVVIPVTLFAWWRYWAAADRSSQNGDR